MNGSKEGGEMIEQTAITGPENDHEDVSGTTPSTAEAESDEQGSGEQYYEEEGHDGLGYGYASYEDNYWGDSWNDGQIYYYQEIDPEQYQHQYNQF